MSEKTIDARGKPCPQPVVETRKVLLEEGPAALRVIVDNRAAVGNVSRMAHTLGRTVRVEEVSAAEFHLVLTAGATSPQTSTPATGPVSAGTAATAAGREAMNVVLLSSAEFGVGERELGELLIRTFIYTLKEVQPAPHAMLFVNSGVHLTTEGSPVLDEICELAGRGVRVLSCGTCLDYYQLKEKLKVGAVTNMFEIVSLLSAADRVIRP